MVLGMRGRMRRELKSLRFFFLLVRRSTFHSTPPSIEQQTLEESIRAAIETKTFHQIPDLFSSPSSSSSYNKKNPNADDTTSYSYESSSSNNPFCFLSSLSQSLKTQIIDDILQSFIPLRPRSRPHLVYSYLLSYTLHYDPTPFPISLAVLQRTLRSGCLPPPQTHLSLSSAWLHRRQYYSSSPPTTTTTTSVSDILLEMRSIGYRPDIGTCNYLLTSLCGVDELEESVRVLEGMSKAGCDPDSESYGAVISAMSEARRSREAEALLKSMVASGGLAPRQGTVGRVVAAMRANGEVRRAVEIVRWLEGYIGGGKGGGIGFEVYEMVVEGCVERGEIVLAGKVVVEMAERGFIPYIRVRQKVYEQLLVVGQVELASLVRQKLAALNS